MHFKDEFGEDEAAKNTTKEEAELRMFFTMDYDKNMRVDGSEIAKQLYHYHCEIFILLHIPHFGYPRANFD